MGWSLGEGVVKDGEDVDPEYNYLEVEDQEYDKEDFRDDRAVKVSSKLFILVNSGRWGSCNCEIEYTRLKLMKIGCQIFHQVVSSMHHIGHIGNVARMDPGFLERGFIYL